MKEIEARNLILFIDDVYNSTSVVEVRNTKIVGKGNVDTFSL